MRYQTTYDYLTGQTIVEPYIDPIGPDAQPHPPARGMPAADVYCRRCGAKAAAALLGSLVGEKAKFLCVEHALGYPWWSLAWFEEEESED